MFKYFIRRILETVPVVLGVSILVFGMLRLIPGGPAVAILGERATPEKVAQIEKQFGLDKPIHQQYFIWAGKMLQGDLGNTLGQVPISKELRNRFPATIELGLSALFIATILGLPIGMISAMKRNSIFDTLSMFGALFGVSIPVFVLGLLLIFFVGVELNLLPFRNRLDTREYEIKDITGLHTVDALLAGDLPAFKDAIEHLILPAFTLSTIPLAIIARITRSSMLEVLNQDYIRTARAKGLRERAIVLRHALSNALLPIITIIGLQLGALLSGAVLTETIFSWPGIGRWLFDSIDKRDYAVVQVVTLLIAVIYVGANLLVDLIYAVVDPRIRYGGAE